MNSLLPRIVGQAQEQHGEKQGGQKAHGVVLIREDAEICAFLFSRKLQINFIVFGDGIHQLVLEHTEPGAEARSDIPPDLMTGLFEDTVGAESRMICRETPEQIINLKNGAGGE